MAEVSIDPKRPTRVRFHYLKSQLWRVVHVDGAIGGITPRGMIHAALYSEEEPGIIVSVSPSQISAIESVFDSLCPVHVIGTVTPEGFFGALGRETLFDLPGDFMAERYGSAISEVACGKITE